MRNARSAPVSAINAKGPTRVAKAPARVVKAPARVAKGPTAKAAAPKAKAARPPLEVTPIRNVMNKTELFQHILNTIGDETLGMHDVKKMYGVLVDTILGSLAPKGVGEFTLPGIIKFMTVKKPAQKGGKKAINRFTGEEYITKPKPASVKVKGRVLSHVKRAAAGE